MDEVPSWWPPVWHDDGDGDRGWYPFGRTPGNGDSRQQPFVREWREDGGYAVRGQRYAIYMGGSTFRTDGLLEVLIFLMALTQESDNVITTG